MSKKGENIYKRKDGRWEGRYIKEYDSGNIKYGYCYGKTYHEVKDKLCLAKANILNTIDDKLLSIYFDEWLSLKRINIKESTYIKYLGIIDNYLKPKLGKYKVDELTSLMIGNYSYELIHKNNLSSKTVKDILTVLHSIIKYIKKDNPNIKRIEISYPKQEKKEMRVLTRNEQEIFTKYLLTDMDNCKFATLLTLLTGLRIGEICALRWQDISLDEEVIYVKASMQRVKKLDTNDKKKTKIIITDPKSVSSIRVIPLNAFALNLCKRFKDEDDIYVLTGRKEYMEPRKLQYRMKKFVNDCNLEGVHFHTLRHSFATRCVEVGFEIKSLSEVLGHASPQITLERYVHSSIELKRENMNKLSLLGY